MRATTRPLFWTAAVIALTIPAAARAQQPLAPVQVSVVTSEADRLDARAEAYEETGSRRNIGKAAGLREKAARLRTPEDPRGFASMQRAALLRHALRQRPAALGLMQQAGDQALARGDVFNAASAYITAAFMASELRDTERVRQYVAKSTLLMHSPLLSESQRSSIQRSLAQGPSVGAEVAAAAAAQP